MHAANVKINVTVLRKYIFLLDNSDVLMLPNLLI